MQPSHAALTGRRIDSFWEDMIELPIKSNQYRAATFRIFFSLSVPVLHKFGLLYEIRLAIHSFMLSSFPILDRCVQAYSMFLGRPKKSLILSESRRTALRRTIIESIGLIAYIHLLPDGINYLYDAQNS